jgi:hypothetical protein
VGPATGPAQQGEGECIGRKLRNLSKIVVRGKIVIVRTTRVRESGKFYGNWVGEQGTREGNNSMCKV